MFSRNLTKFATRLTYNTNNTRISRRLFTTCEKPASKCDELRNKYLCTTLKLFSLGVVAYCVHEYGSYYYEDYKTDKKRINRKLDRIEETINSHDKNLTDLIKFNKTIINEKELLEQEKLESLRPITTEKLLNLTNEKNTLITTSAARQFFVNINKKDVEKELINAAQKGNFEARIYLENVELQDKITQNILDNIASEYHLYLANKGISVNTVKLKNNYSNDYLLTINWDPKPAVFSDAADNRRDDKC